MDGDVTNKRSSEKHTLDELDVLVAGGGAHFLSNSFFHFKPLLFSIDPRPNNNYIKTKNRKKK